MKLMEFYNNKYEALRVASAYNTPRAAAQSIRVAPTGRLLGPVGSLITITGDPQHDVFAVNRLASAQSTDKADFCFDHRDELKHFVQR